MVQLESISKKWRNGHEIIKKLSFEIEPGYIHLIQGVSGSGKSSFLNIAAGFLAPSDGKVFFEGKTFDQFNSKEKTEIYADKIGFSFQDGQLIPYLSVKENIVLPALSSKGVILKRDENRAELLAEQLHIKDRLNMMPHQLSSGEQKRVSLARAIFNEPRYLFADEPAGNLDDENAVVVSEILQQFAIEGAAVIIASHNKSSLYSSVQGVKIKKLELKKQA